MSNGIFISYSHKDKKWLERLQINLIPLVNKYPLNVWDDTRIRPSNNWKEEIQTALASANVAILLVSQNFLASSFIKDHELEPLLSAAKLRGIKILWVAVSSSMVEETEISAYHALNNPQKPLDQLSGADWRRELVEISKRIKEAANLTATIIQPPPNRTETIIKPLPNPDVEAYYDKIGTNRKREAVSPDLWEAEGGAVPLDSPFYIDRPIDNEMYAAIKKGSSIIRIKGVRQVGKTSLMARGIQAARDNGAKVVFTDFESLGASNLLSLEKFYLQIARLMALELGLDTFLEHCWDENIPPNKNFENYVRDIVLSSTSSSLVWALDEVDRLFNRTYTNDVFGLLRSWHNNRANQPKAPWGRFTLMIAYATEPYLYIKDINESPFNVGVRVALADFNKDQVAELNFLYGSPLQAPGELEQYCNLVGGHPYLVRRGLHYLAQHRAQNNGGFDLSTFEAQADSTEEPFGDHLRRILALITQDSVLCEAVREALRGRPLTSPETFYRLESAGVVVGASAQLAKMRCKLYTKYLKRHLLFA